MTASAAELPRLMLTVLEAAEILKVGRSTVYGLIDSGELESVRIGRLRRIPMEAVTDYVARKRSGS
jgi:excisionase family DNA binding protein